MVKSQIDTSLKYQIENDTFSSRKIIVEEQLSHEEIIQKYIINDDFNLTKALSTTKNKDIQKDEELHKLLLGQNLKNKRARKATKDIFDQLYKNLKRESDEV